MEPVIEAIDVWKVYGTGKIKYPALRGLTFTVYKGEMLSIMGASGSGKSTLLNIVGALDKPTKGKIIVEGTDISKLDDIKLALFRRRTIGFVFQSFNLIPRLTALENVEIPMIAEGIAPSERRKRAQELLDMLGIGDRALHKPSEMSGGEQQRVAIARALANNPRIVLADEPTGNLDTKNKKIVMDMLRKLNEKMGVTIIVVTHDPEVGERTDRILYIKDGKIVGEKVPGEKNG
jgi:putative ABC transport system ATP-binding protein